MIRVYFDTNIFSNLEGNTLEIYQQLTEALKLHKHNLSFIFSPAHIRDKRKADERKIDYFKFMGTLVGNNHISYHALEKTTTMYLATPMMVYNDDEPSGEDTSNLLNSEAWDTIKELFRVIPLPFETSKFKEIPEERKDLFGKMLPLDKENPTMYDLMEKQLSFSQLMKEDNNLYKELRGYIFDNFNKGKYTANDGEIDFNEAFKDSHFEKTFAEYVKSCIYTKHEGRILFIDFYLQSYNTLDIIGISKDDIKPRNGFNNIHNDAFHSYYATHCDYLVTEDKGLKRKSKALYNLYNIPTVVLNAREFLELLPSIGQDTERDGLHFVEKLNRDIVEGLLQEPQDASDGSVAYPVRVKEKYFNSFDQMFMFVLPNGEIHYTLQKFEEYYYSGLTYREYEKVVNRCIQLFGNDIHNYGIFNFDTEVEQIRNDAWPGRFWKFGNVIFILHLNVGSKKFSMQIGPFYLPNNSSSNLPSSDSGDLNCA